PTCCSPPSRARERSSSTTSMRTSPMGSSPRRGTSSGASPAGSCGRGRWPSSPPPSGRRRRSRTSSSPSTPTNTRPPRTGRPDMQPLRLATSEIARHSRPLNRLAVIFLLIVPTLYGALYLWSNWDPYGDLDQVPVAVVNEDEPVTVDGTD